MINITVTELEKLQRRIRNCEQANRHSLTLTVTEARMLLSEVEKAHKHTNNTDPNPPAEIYLVGEPF